MTVLDTPSGGNADISRRLKMKVGDLVRHKRFGRAYVVTDIDKSALVGVSISGELRYILRDWLEVINASR